MNKKLILIVLSVVMFCSASYAQKVIKSGSAVIIDCSDMDPRFYSSTKIYPRTTTATNSTGRTNGAADISSPESNAKVYKKFEVNRTDNNMMGTDWKGAVTSCANLNSNGTGWRLPTQRELMLIWLLKEKLAANGMLTTHNAYWSATQGYSSEGYRNAYWMNHDDGGGGEGLCGTFRFGVRCIRDL